MIYKINLGLALIVLTFASTSVSAQSESKLQTKGEQFLSKEMYEEALEYFSQRDEKTQLENPLYNYYMGLALYHIPERKGEATRFLEIYIEKGTVHQMAYYEHQHVYYMLAKTYQSEFKWEMAEAQYSEFINQVNLALSIPADSREGMIEAANKEIIECQNARNLADSTQKASIVSQRESVNSGNDQFVSQNDVNTVGNSDIKDDHIEKPELIVDEIRSNNYINFDLHYTIQIGVYTKEISNAVFRNIQPINSQKTEQGLINYSSGKFDSYETAYERKLEIIELGISDAFVTAYYQGKRISMSEAKQMTFDRVDHSVKD